MPKQNPPQSLAEALRLAHEVPSDQSLPDDLVRFLRQQDPRDQGVFVADVSNAARVDAAEAQRLAAFCARHPSVKVPPLKGRTLNQWLADRSPPEEDEACPVTGAPLFDGVVFGAQLDPPLTWAGVPKERRRLAALGAELGLVRGAHLARTLAHVMRKAAYPDTPEWDATAARLLKLDADKAANRLSDTDADLLRRVDRRLRYAEARDETLSGCIVAPPPEVVKSALSTAWQQARVEVRVTGSGNHVGSKPTRVLVMHTQADQAAYESLVAHTGVMRRQYVITLQSYEGDVPPGGNCGAVQSRMLAGADVVVLILSADLLATSMPALALAEQARRGVRLLPVRWRSCSLSGDLSVRSSVPRSGKAISAMTDRDDGWVEVVGEIRSAVSG